MSADGRHEIDPVTGVILDDDSEMFRHIDLRGMTRLQIDAYAARRKNK